MQYPIIVRTKDDDHYEAEPMGIPELRIIADTEEDALKKMAKALGKWFTSAKVVQVEIPVKESKNPWLDAFGRSASDPDFDDFMKAIHVARTEDISE